ncbi:MAG: hypothetical protein WCE79_14165 [Xanthobacteraceae bacterium]
MRQLVGAFLVRVVIVPLAGLLVSRTALAVAHSFEWYPEEQLARLVVTSPTLFQIEAVWWGLWAVLTLALWGLADRFIYRRSGDVAVSLSVRVPWRWWRRSATTQPVKPKAGFVGIEEAVRRILLREEWIDRTRKEKDEKKQEAIREEVRQIVRQHARLGKIKIWGRVHGEIDHKPVAKSYWNNFKFETTRSVIDWSNPGTATKAQELVDLKVERAKFDVLYPPDESGGFARATVVPPKRYDRQAIEAIGAAVRALYQQVLIAEEVAISLKGLSGSLIGILSQHDGRRKVLKQWEDAREKLAAVQGDVSKIVRENGLYEDELTDAKNMFYQEQFWPAYQNLAGAIRDTKTKLSAAEWEIYLEARKPAFDNGVKLLSDWATYAKTHLSDKQAWLAMQLPEEKRQTLDKITPLNQAREELWKLRKEGVELRNEGKATRLVSQWNTKYEDWHARLIATAVLVSSDLGHSFDPLGKIEARNNESVALPNAHHQKRVSAMSEKLERLYKYLSKEP